MRHHTVHLVALTSALLCACASRQAIVNRTATALEAAQSYYLVADEAAQMQILADAPDRPTFEERIGEHRKQQAQVKLGLQAAWGALAAAALEPSDINMQRLAELASKAIAAVNGGMP
jgi:hypothetical protein